MPELVLSARGLKVNFHTYDGVVKALDGVDFDLRPNETHGLVGETGCGKSVTVNTLLRLIPMPPGRIEGGRALLHAPIPCPSCGGKGCLACGGSGIRDTCERCGGKKSCTSCRGFGRYADGKTCRACRVTGRCASCEGSGGRYVDLLALTPKELREIRGGSISIILQEPMSALNPVLTVAEQVGEAFYYHQREELVRSTLRSLDHAIREAQEHSLVEPRPAHTPPKGVLMLSALFFTAMVVGFILAAASAVAGGSLLAVGGVLAFFGFANLLVGLGLWRVRARARSAGVWIALAGVFLGLFAFPAGLLLVILDLVILLYIGQPSIRSAFPGAPPSRLSVPVIRFYRTLYRRMLASPESRTLQVLRRVPFLKRYHRWIDREARARSLEALKIVRIPSPAEVLGAYPHELSGGMMQRVVIAIALASRPRVLIADEPTTALDVTIQSQILKLMSDLKAELGTAIIFITHDLAVIAQVSDRVSVMYAGTIAESSGVRTIFREPLHPYTRGLVRAIPGAHQDVDRLPEIAGSVPNLVVPPPGCRFHPRCPFAKDVCKMEKPLLVEAREGHRVACHMYNENAAQWTDADRLLPLAVVGR